MYPRRTLREKIKSDCCMRDESRKNSTICMRTRKHTAARCFLRYPARFYNLEISPRALSASVKTKEETLPEEGSEREREWRKTRECIACRTNFMSENDKTTLTRYTSC